MSMRLQPCSGCSRHVRVGDPICPFCGASVSVRSEGRPVRSAAARLSRAALFAAGTAGAAVAGADCSAQPMYGGSYLQPMYGGVFFPDAGMEQEASTPTPDASKMLDANATADATAMPDAAALASESSTADDSSSAPDVPMAVAMYGGIAIPDSGPVKDEDAPSIAPPYGIAPLYGGFAPIDAEVKAD
jgi:hypothetical protein